jgi:CRP-like cAMP-binding protein
VDFQERTTLGPGDHFGEMALLDAGTRTASVIAPTALVGWGVTFWDFQPLVEENGVIRLEALAVADSRSNGRVGTDARQRGRTLPRAGRAALGPRTRRAA